MKMACGWLVVLLGCALAASGCGDDGGNGATVPGGRRDAGRDRPPRPDSGPDKKPPIKTPVDSGVDSGRDAEAGPCSPCPFDGSGDYDASPPDVAGPPPAGWTCLPALWADGYCDCGCSVADWDCQGSSCITKGCVHDICEACYTPLGAWKACLPDPNPDDWLCATLRADPECSCGCGIPDPDCYGQGCTEPGCLEFGGECDARYGCDPGVLTAASDTCAVPGPNCECQNSNTAPAGWRCPPGDYGAGNGCDCGCGALDPDCQGDGCLAGRCYDATCDLCHDELSPARPYDCAAAQAGWDDDIVLGGGSERSDCNATRFGTGDGCDCGCGGLDPDCATGGCGEPGCSETACNRCTDPTTREPTGCSVPSTWQLGSGCSPENYGTGDGCDCGCGTADPDCVALGKAGSTDPSAHDASCDVCHNGVGGVEPCPSWDCEENAGAFYDNLACDCGCGVIDPYCRDAQRLSCMEPGCSTEACNYSNNGATRSPITSAWLDGAGSGGCEFEHYGLDGLCDCGCGAADPDCGDQGCTERGCMAPGCDVCHDGSRNASCRPWFCADEARGDGICDCGCGAEDPDCGTGGCRQPGCKTVSPGECDVCHDPLGRTVPCP